MGIVWHTTYSGSTFETMKASFGGDIVSKIKPSKNVWMQDATMKDLSGTATLTKEESLELASNLSNAGKIFKTDCK